MFRAVQRKTKASVKRVLDAEFVRFCIVGGIATAMNYGFFLLLYLLGTNYLAASAAGYIIGVLGGFVLNRRFTFRSRSVRYGREMASYFGVYTVSLFLGLGLLRLLVGAGVNVLIANVATIGLTTTTNYVGSRFLVFRSHRAVVREEPR
jgi:putative flippase GtrA